MNDVATIRVVMADDHPMFRDGLRMALGTMAGVELVGEVGTGVDAVTEARRHRPDVVLMDLNLPDLHGIEATRQIMETNPDTAVLVLTMYDDDESVFEAMRAGARGYVLKGAHQDDIERAVRAVARGEAIFGPQVASRLLRFMSSPRQPSASGVSAQPPAEPFPQLTAREREVLTLLAQGLSNPAIAARLYLSPKTIRNNVSDIFAKLQVADRAAAMIVARDAGLG
jgi:DNA-binding NarL/FixJ family response regulator